MKLPSFQFYPADWKKDPNLQSVSHAAKGLWIDILCLMFESERRGYLQLNGKPPSNEQLARMVNCSAGEVDRLIAELRDAGVFSESTHKIIFSRRMVRDSQLRDIRGKCGKLGGNPAFKKGAKNPYYITKDKQIDKVRDKQKITPSSSSSSSSSSSKTNTPAVGCELADVLDPEGSPPGTYVNPTTGEVRPKRRKSPPREPDPIWDAVAVAWFGGKVAEPDYARVGKIVRDLKAHEATPADIPLRIGRYRAEWPAVECTPESMVRHWSRFAQPTPKIVVAKFTAEMLRKK